MSLKDLLPKVIYRITSSSNTPPEVAPESAVGSFTTATTTNSPGIAANSSFVTYPIGTYTADPSYWNTITGTSPGISLNETAEFTKLKCKLPEGALEKLMTIGLIKSKKVLKQRIEEAFTKWCNTGEMEVSVFPMLLAACVLIMKDEDETKEKEEK